MVRQLVPILFAGWVISLAAITFPACTGNNTDDVGAVYEIDSISKLYCLFPKGTIWIYQLEGTILRDTIELTRAEEFTESANNEISSDGFKHWHFSFESRNLFNDSRLAGKGVVYPLVGTYHPYISRSTYHLHDGGATFVSIFFGSDSVGLNLKDLGGDNLTITDQIDSLELNGVVYNDVLAFENKDQYWSTVPVKLLWSPKVGRIKIESGSGEIWTLVNYLPK